VTGANIQDGYKQMFAGAMMGIRNPKAHHNITISRTRAIEFPFCSEPFLQQARRTKEPVTNRILMQNYHLVHKNDDWNVEKQGAEKPTKIYHGLSKSKAIKKAAKIRPESRAAVH